MGNPLTELGLSPSDLGLGGGDGGEAGDSIQIDHKIHLSMSNTMEESIRNAIDTIITKSTKKFNRMIHVVGYAIATYLVFSGIAKIIDARSSSSSPKIGRNSHDKDDKHGD